jgi:serine/threonine protein kinase
LKEIHEGGFIHRDISPDNIMISDLSNRVYLIDFGTARANSAEEDKTISVFKKSGYTPPEQLRTKGKQGPWTDIYALCGTIYRCITGIKPIDVTDRLFGEELVRPSDYGIPIAPQIEDAIMKGLEIHNEDRYQCMDDLYNAIYKSDAWLNASDEEYTKVVEAVRNYKIHGNPRPKIEEVYRKKAEKENHVQVNRPVYENEHDEAVRIVSEYKKTPEYIAAYDKYMKEDPEILRQLEYEKIKEIVKAFKSDRQLDAEAKEYIADVVIREMEQK